jgi:competence protein ComEC
MKNLFKYIPFQLLLCLILGILFGNNFPLKPIYLYWIYIFLTLILVSVYKYSNKQFGGSWLFSTVVFLFSFFIGIGAITFKNGQNKTNFYVNKLSFSQSSPQTSLLLIQKVLKPTKYYQKYEATVLQLNSKNVSGKILINILKDSTLNLLRVDDKILVKGIFTKIQDPKNPFEFNYKNYLKHQQIFHQIVLSKSAVIFLQKSNTIKGLAASTREKITNALEKNGFKNNELAVINALLLGQRQDISEDLMQSYIGAGAIHILAVSGLHVGIILLLLNMLFKPLNYFKNGKLIATVCVILLLWLFAILAGLSASVIRAVAMFTAIAFAMFSNKSSNVYHALVISMFFLLLFNANYLFEVGFQLSYLAVFAIVWIQPKIYNLWVPKFWIVTKFWQLFTVSIAAQLGVLPLSLYYFHQFPGLFFVSNLVIIPFLGIILALGIIVILCSLIGFLPTFVANTYLNIIQQMNGFIDFIGNQHFFIIQQITFSFALLIASYLVIISFFYWFQMKNFSRTKALLFSIIFLQMVFIFEKYERVSAEKWIVFHKNKESIVANHLGEKLLISSSKTNFINNQNPVNNYVVGNGIKEVIMLENKSNLHFFKHEIILVVDSLGLYNFKTIQPTIVVLQQSPKVNLDRLLAHLNPKMIVCDGSNYKSYVSKWEQTCIQNKTPFYSTLKNGALQLN